MLGLTVMLAIGFAFLIRALFNNHKGVARVTETSVIVVGTKQLFHATTSLSIVNTPLPNYEALSPTKIKKGAVIFDIYATWLTCTELDFEIAGTFPQDFPLESNGMSIFKSMELIPSPSNVSLKLDTLLGVEAVLM